MVQQDGLQGRVEVSVSATPIDDCGYWSEVKQNDENHEPGELRYRRGEQTGDCADAQHQMGHSGEKRQGHPGAFKQTKHTQTAPGGFAEEDAQILVGAEMYSPDGVRLIDLKTAAFQPQAQFRILRTDQVFVEAAHS